MKTAINHITYKNANIHILRLDIIQAEIQGNKYYKLKYNLEYAKKLNKKTLLTFGGEFSNHIHATSLAGLKHDFNTIGIIRGDKPQKYNSTIQDCVDNKMKVYYLNRTDYRIARKLVNNNENENFYSLLSKNDINLKNTDNIYIIPEGGTNKLALKGTQEILKLVENLNYKTVCCPVGTAGTIVGIISSSKTDKTILGFPALKGNFFEKDIKNLLNTIRKEKYSNWKLNHDYHLKGFGAYNDDLIYFINNFYEKFNIPLCTLYTGKMFYGIFDLIDKGVLTNQDKILAIHTGGIQGRKAFNEKNGDLLIL